MAPRAAVAFSKVLPSADDWGPIVQGLNQAYTDGPAVVNMGFGNCGDLPPSTVQTAISRFTTRVPADAANPGVGVSLVASAGNGTLTSPTPCPTTAVSYPAAYSEVIAVAAIDQNNATMQGFSVGPDVELSAPGICVKGLLVGGGDHPCLTGTSFAAAHVAGLIAAIRATNNTWSAADVRGRLQATATKIAGQTLPRDNRFGYGLINAYTAVQDTSRPPLPGSAVLPDDSTRALPSPFGTAERYYRDVVGVMFDDTTSGRTIRATLTKYQASIVAGGVAFPYPVYYLQIPNPGGTYAAIDSKARAIQAETGVFSTYVPQWRGRLQLRSRYPNDGPSARRADWFSSTDGTRALLAIRAPLAWGCETGTYGNTARVAIIDRQFEAHNDLVTRQIRAPVSRIQFNRMPTVDDLEHANRVAGILGATGDNGIGIAGMMWNSDLTLYALGASGGESSNPYHDFVYHLVHINDTLGTRVLTMSATFGTAADTANIRWIVQALRIYFQRGGILIYAIGNDNARPTLAQLRSTTDTTFSGVDRALAILRDSLGFAANILTVGATDTTGAFLVGTNYWLGGTDVLAPGQRILTLGVSNTTSLANYGTSYATPYVAGVAAQLLATDPTLTAAQVKDYIVRGARQPRWNPRTQQVATPQPVPGAPETVYQLDAYSALTLHARERPGAPLCGNRVWVAGTQLVAQRDTTAPLQVLANLGERAAFVNVHHGGRRVDVWNDNFVQRSFVFGQGTWTESANPPTSPDGGAWNSLWSLSHDGDSAVTLQMTGANGSRFEVLRGPTRGASTHLADITVPLTASGSMTCLWVGGASGACGDSAFTGYSESAFWNAAAYSPLGDRVIVTITKESHQSTSISGFSTCPWALGGEQPDQCRTIDYLDQTVGTTFYTVDLHSGTQSALATAPVEAWWGALAEDGGQLVTGEGAVSQTSTLRPHPSGAPGYELVSGPQNITGCTLRYRQASTGLPSRLATASDDVCRGPLGGGSAAPAPPIRVGSQ